MNITRLFLLSACLFLPSCEPPKQLKQSSANIRRNDDSKAVLATKLNQMTKDGHKPLTYRKLWEALRYIDGEADNVRLIYSRELRAKDMNGGSKGDWNREHVWPRSYGIGKTGSDYTDLHAIFPCDVSKNSSRSNKFFDNETDRDSWLPPAEIRGDIARAMFYMAVRYEGTEENTSDLHLSDKLNAETSGLGKLSVLLKWHEQDPVSDAERKRNERVEKMQGNRNPFVDEPEKVNLLYSETTK